jgi:hypothetical protein
VLLKYVKGFRNVRRRELDNDSFPTFGGVFWIFQSKFWITTPCLRILEYGWYYCLNEGSGIEKEGNVNIIDYEFIDKGRFWKLININ